MSMINLTVEEGIAIQKKHLAEWKQLLKPKVYKWLEERATRDNHLATNGFQIKRGSDLSCDVSNYLYYNSEK